MAQSPSSTRYTTQKIGYSLLFLITLSTVIPIILVVAYIFIQGFPAISWSFITDFPSEGMRAGGILPAIIGTFYLNSWNSSFCRSFWHWRSNLPI